MTQMLAIGLGVWVLPHSGATAQVKQVRSLDNAPDIGLSLSGANIRSLPSDVSLGDLDENRVFGIINTQNTQLVEQTLSLNKSVKADASQLGAMILQLPTIVRGADVVLTTNDDKEVEEVESSPEQTNSDTETLLDEELGVLRVRSQPVGIDGELGVLRIRAIEDVPLEVEPEPTRQTTVFLTGRSNVYGGNNLFRTPNPIDDRIYQAGLGLFAFPKLGEKTNLIISAEANVARYEDLSVVDYNEVQVQAGIRQRLGTRSYGQLNWRYQDLSTPGSDSFFSSNYMELLLSRRDILNNRTWLDAYYQARLSISDPKEFSRFSQIATGSINYGFDPQTRVSLLYQLFLDDYTETSRHDTYHQVLAQFSHDLSKTTRVSLFTGFRFGRSSRSNVDFDDTIYGASINVNLPLF
ncbi:MAG: hypothetical protein AAF959_12960 [Cyanobacteria bacterium P01_D01_bin.56]